MVLAVSHNHHTEGTLVGARRNPRGSGEGATCPLCVSNELALLPRYLSIRAQVESGRWRHALQIANQVAIDQFLELNTIWQHPKVVAELMVKNGVKPGIALQFVSSIKKF